MDPETARRFRLAALGYVILTVAVIAALTIGYVQEHEIKDSQHEIKSTQTLIRTSGEHLAALLAEGTYRLCLSDQKVRSDANLPPGKVDCKRILDRADDIYRLLTK